MEKKNGLVFTWTLYPQAEDLLRSKGYIFEKVTIPMDQFDLKWSRHNCARLDEAIIESYVEAIMQSMANGDSYPMPVAIQLKSGLFGLLDGNQRDEGARRLGATAMKSALAAATYYERPAPNTAAQMV